MACPKRNPSFAKSIVGWTRSFQGNLPYSFQASWNPLTSPGTPEAEGPAALSATVIGYPSAIIGVGIGGV